MIYEFIIQEEASLEILEACIFITKMHKKAWAKNL